MDQSFSPMKSIKSNKSTIWLDTCYVSFVNFTNFWGVRSLFWWVVTSFVMPWSMFMPTWRTWISMSSSMSFPLRTSRTRSLSRFRSLSRSSGMSSFFSSFFGFWSWSGSAFGNWFQFYLLFFFLFLSWLFPFFSCLWKKSWLILIFLFWFFLYFFKIIPFKLNFFFITSLIRNC